MAGNKRVKLHSSAKVNELILTDSNETDLKQLKKNTLPVCDTTRREADWFFKVHSKGRPRWSTC